MPVAVLIGSTPFSPRKKSKCHHERRNSPSVASFSPTSSCFLTILSISRSSTAFNAAASISFLAYLVRASFSGAVRSRLPTWSARKGGVVRWDMIVSFPHSNNCAKRSHPRDSGDPALLATRFPPVVWLISPPNLVRQLDDHVQLGPLLVLGKHVAFLGGREATLRGQAKLFKRDIFGRLLDTLFDIGAGLQPAGLRCDQTQHHDLFALRQEAQRLEAASTIGIVFEEVTVVVALAEQIFCNGLVAARRNKGRTKVASTDMGCDCHVGRLCRKALVDAADVGFLQVIDVKAPLLGLRQLLLRAQIGPGGVVPLQIAAASIVKGTHRFLIGHRQIVEDGIAVRIGGFSYGAGLEAEMNHAWRGDGHLRSHFGVCLQELEMLHHGVIREANLARDADALRLGLDPLKLDAVIELVKLHPVEHAEEIEVPVGSSKLAIGCEPEADFLLLLDDLFDFAVFDLLELITADGPLLASGTRVLQRLAA